MTESADKTPLRLVEVTRAEYESGRAFDNWEGDTNFGRIGGSFGEMVLSSPVRKPSDDDLLLLAVLLKNQPIGCMHTFNGKLHVGSQTIDMLWCSGLIVLPEHRNTGAGLTILLRMRSHPIASGGVRVSQMAMPLYRKLGWHTITADRYLLVKKSAPILRRWIRSNWLLKPASILANTGLGLHRLLLAAFLRIRLSAYHCEETDRLPDDLDPLIRDLQWPAKCHRSTEWINWAVNSGPKQNNRKLYLVKTGNGQPVGYFMTGQMYYEEADQGRIRNITLACALDWMSFDSGTDDSVILMLALQKLLGADADAIELCVPETRSGRALRKLGLLRKGELNMVIRFAPGTSGVKDLKFDGDNFWFRPADADGFLN